jgi:hypothetical protein
MMVDTSKRVTSISACLSNSKEIEPLPLSEVEFTFLIPFTLAIIASSLLVTSASITRDELPGILKETVRPGKVRDGASLTGNNGTNTTPISDRQTNVTIRVNEERLRGLLIDKFQY